MRRIILTLVAAAALSACNDMGPYDHSAMGYHHYASCRQFTSCGECTPVLGCGWCSYGQGLGACVDEPNDCNTQQFTWTWEPAGCGVTTDAGVLPDDAATDGSDVAGDAAPE